ncbi:hypothetical protein KV102_00335 [Mumia sp. zg.B53]|uniref:hypothetical protein n=1 Tax=Mumia sp. zg.B53 TaxID=2855449 RepID=UPI001C6DFE66|nr:hypothetical protein [Mumia sp. zg.B53]MBW9213273.1 hypothetical protein [Mumia sp. zg.B53]
MPYVVPMTTTPEDPDDDNPAEDPVSPTRAAWHSLSEALEERLRQDYPEAFVNPRPDPRADLLASLNRLGRAREKRDALDAIASDEMTFGEATSASADVDADAPPYVVQSPSGDEFEALQSNAARDFDSARDEVTGKAAVLAVDADAAAKESARQAKISNRHAKISNLIAGVAVAVTFVATVVPGVVDLLDGNEPTRVIVEDERP